MTTLTTNGVRHRKHTHRRAGRAGPPPVPPSFLSGGWRGGGGLGGRQADITCQDRTGKQK